MSYTHLCGWKDDQSEVQRLLKDNPHNNFKVAAAAINGSGKGKSILLSKAIEQLIGHYNTRLQKIGDCVSMGSATAVDCLKAIQIILGSPGQWIAETCTEAIYGLSRVEIGNGQLRGSDGSVGAWAAEACKKYGTLARIKYGNWDLSQYDPNRAKTWGDAGLPNELEPFAAEHLVRAYSPIKTYLQAIDALINGYPITIASTQGFGDQWGRAIRDKDGFMLPTATWPHQMCFLPNTLINKDLPKVIQDISVGENVLGPDGEFYKVVEIFDRDYDGPILKIKIRGGLPIDVTPNHPILIGRYEEGSFDENNSSNIIILTKKLIKQWIKAKDILIGDYVFSPAIIEGNNNYLPSWQKSSRKTKNSPKDISLDDDIAWLFGLYAADGYSKIGHKCQITLNSHEIDLAERCVKAWSKIGINAHTSIKKNCIRVTVYSSIIANSMYEWFGKQTNKHLPEWLFNNGWNLREVLNGLMDGDGCQRANGQLIFTNTSRALIEQTRNILLSLGEKPGLFVHEYKNIGQENWNDRYRLEWRENPLNRSYNNFWHDNDYVMKVTDIECFDYKGKVYNFEVEDCHSYVANGYSVHNCIIGFDDSFYRPGVLVSQSWGPDWCSGPTRLGQPPGSFWVDADVIEQRVFSANDSFAYSNFEGYPPQKIDFSNLIRI